MGFIGFLKEAYKSEEVKMYLRHIMDGNSLRIRHYYFFKDGFEKNASLLKMSCPNFFKPIQIGNDDSDTLIRNHAMRIFKHLDGIIGRKIIQQGVKKLS